LETRKILLRDTLLEDMDQGDLEAWAEEIFAKSTLFFVCDGQPAAQAQNEIAADSKRQHPRY
jgi:hypothetical protein